MFRCLNQNPRSAIMVAMCIACTLVVHSPSAFAETTSLQQALNAAQNGNEDYKIVEARIRQSSAQRREALAGLLPRLSGGLSGTVNANEVEFGDRSVVPRYDWDGGVRASLVIFDGTLYPAYSEAKRLEEATEAEARWQRHGLEFEVEQAYYSLVAAESEVEVAERTVELREAYANQAKALADQGIALPLDSARARSQFLEAKQGLLVANVRLQNVSDSLSILMNRPADGTLRAQPLTDQERGGPPGAVGELFRPDLKATDLFIESLESRENSVWWSLAPSLEVVGAMNFGPESFSNPDGISSSISLQLSWLLYDGGARYARIDAIQAQTDESMWGLQRQTREATAEQTRALRNWRAAFTAIALAQEKLEVANEAYELARGRFDAGLATSIEVTQASDDLVRAELDLVSAKLLTDLARSSYKYVIGVQP